MSPSNEASLDELFSGWAKPARLVALALSLLVVTGSTVCCCAVPI